MRTEGGDEWDTGRAEEDLKRATVFMLVGMLSIGFWAGACAAACLLGLLGGGW